MEDNKNSKIMLAALAGAAIGIAIGYFLNSDKKDEILNDIKGGASKLKDDLAEGFDNLKNSAEEHFKNPTT
jgi:hypothetical protein